MASVVDELDEEVGSDIPPWKLPALSGPAEGDQIVKKSFHRNKKKKNRQWLDGLAALSDLTFPSIIGLVTR